MWLSSFDVELPLECDDEFWEHPTDPFVQPKGQISQMSFWYQNVKLLRIVGLVKDNLVSLELTLYYDRPLMIFNAPVFHTEISAMVGFIGRKQCRHRHRNWLCVEQLARCSSRPLWASPDFLSYSIIWHLHHWSLQVKWNPHHPDDNAFVQLVALHGNYYWVQIQAHKLFIRSDSLSTSSFPSLAICTNAARSFAHIIQAYHSRPNSFMLSLFIVKISTFHSVILILTSFQN